MRHDKINKKNNFMFLGGFAVFWIFVMLIIAGLGTGWNTCENRMLQGLSCSWWQGCNIFSQKSAETIEVSSTEGIIEDINELRPSNAFFPPMFYESSYQSIETTEYNSIDIKPMKAIRFGRERDASGVQNDVHVVAMPGYFFK